MESNCNQEYYLRCERNSVFLLLMAVSGMMGAYTFILRGGAFCNAQTANIVIMSIAFGERQMERCFFHFFYSIWKPISQEHSYPKCFRLLSSVTVLSDGTPCLLPVESFVLFFV